MSFWNLLGNMAVSDKGETIQKVGENNYISSTGTSYKRMDGLTVGSDGSVFTQMGNFSSDGSMRTGSTATGLGAVFNTPSKSHGGGSRFMADDEDDF